MPLRGRVGRHTKLQGRHCQNWTDDQTTVIDLLSRIPAAEGGAGDSLIGSRIVNGMASAALYGAITHFEDTHFPGQRSGFVDPGGAMLKRMEELAANRSKRGRWYRDPDDPQPIPKPDMLGLLLGNVLDESDLTAREVKHFTARERVDFAPLLGMAVKHIEDLKKMGMTDLPWGVELFGRAYIHSWRKWASVDSDGTVEFRDYDDADYAEELPLPEMRFGSPVESHLEITTGKMGALLLYAGGDACRVRPYHTGHVSELAKPTWSPRPIVGADKVGIR